MSPSVRHAVGVFGLCALGGVLFASELPDRPGAAMPQGMTPGLVMALQIELDQRGFDPGPIDGIAGSRTQAAIRAFESWAGRPDQSPTSDALLLELRRVP